MRIDCGVPPRSPTARQVRALRELRGHTLAAAAAAVGVTLRSWQRYEADAAATAADGVRVMPSPAWELYLLDCLHAGVTPPEPFAGYLRERWPGFGKRKGKRTA